MNLNFIKSSEKRRIIEKLKEQFGIQNLPYLLIKSGKEKIRAFSGHLSKEEIYQISHLTNIEVIGLYLLKEEDNVLRLSIDAIHHLKDQITENIVKINHEQLNEWLRGNNLEIQTKKGIVIIKNNEDFIGCGKSTGQKILNYVPKNRRLKNRADNIR